MAGLALRRRRPVHSHGREGLPCTLIVLWVPGQEAPWVVLTDEAPEDVELGAYGMRVWIEQGFRSLKRMGWQWHRTRRLDPVRVDRHWLVLAVATLWVLAHGTRVEEAYLRGLAPGRVRTPPLQPAGGPPPTAQCPAGPGPGPSGSCTAATAGPGSGCSPCPDRIRPGSCGGWTRPDGSKRSHIDPAPRFTYPYQGGYMARR